MARNKNTRRNNPLASSTAEAMLRKQASYWKWRNFIDRLLMNRINWKGLPDSVDERFLEYCLALNGKAVLYMEEDTLLATRVVFQDKPDVNENFHKFTSIGPGWSRPLEEDEGVLVWGSTTRRVDWAVYDVFATDLAELDELARTNRKQQRWAKVMTVPEGSFNDAARMLEKLDMGDPVTVGLSDLMEKIGAHSLDLSSPYLQKEFHEDKDSILSELYLYLGIRNVGRDKAAYMNYNEVGLSNDAVARMREDLLLPRRQAAEAANTKWGLDIEVEWRDESELGLATPDTSPSGVRSNNDE